jgi:hypothetical protein
MKLLKIHSIYRMINIIILNKVSLEVFSCNLYHEYVTTGTVLQLTHQAVLTRKLIR